MLHTQWVKNITSLTKRGKESGSYKDTTHPVLGDSGAKPAAHGPLVVLRPFRKSEHPRGSQGGTTALICRERYKQFILAAIFPTSAQPHASDFS